VILTKNVKTLSLVVYDMPKKHIKRTVKELVEASEFGKIWMIGSTKFLDSQHKQLIPYIHEKIR